ncbi:MAG: hypothetical protein M5R36_05810 [Deltaproteobacteria bacterium]|nr:hypothetical protein [Deltaproteobacteria bacterium]
MPGQALFRVLSLAVALAFALAFACAQDDGDEGEDEPVRKDGSDDDVTGDDEDDDSAVDDDNDADDDIDDDTGWHPPDDDDTGWHPPDDDDDSTWHPPDDDDSWHPPDDDVDDDIDDDVDDDDMTGDNIYGMVVGENNLRDAAFLGVVRLGRITRKNVPLDENARLMDIDYKLPSRGVTVGVNHVTHQGLAWIINGETVTALPVPLYAGSWSLEGAAVVDANEAYMVGHNTDTDGTRGVILHYEDSVTSKMTPPEISGDWKLKSVFFYSSTKGWAAGYNETSGQPILLGYAGVAWFPVDLDEVVGTTQLAEVQAPNAFQATAVGWTIPFGETTRRGFSLYYDGADWRQTYTFPGGGKDWEFTTIAVLSQLSAFSYAVIDDRLVQWKQTGSSWAQTLLSITWDDGGFVTTGLSMANSLQGLLALRHETNPVGEVWQMNSGVWSRIADHPTSLGTMYDVIVVKLE